MLREKAFALELATSAMWIATSIALVGHLVSRRHTESIGSLMRRLAEACLSSLLPDESKELSALLLSAEECKRVQTASNDIKWLINAYPFVVTSVESHGKDWWTEIEWNWCLCSPMTLTYYDTWNNLQSDSQIEIHRVHVSTWIWSVLHRDFMKFCMQCKGRPEVFWDIGGRADHSGRAPLELSPVKTQVRLKLVSNLHTWGDKLVCENEVKLHNWRLFFNIFGY